MKKLIVISIMFLFSFAVNAQEWISNGESGLSVRTKLNNLKDTVDYLLVEVGAGGGGTTTLLGDATGSGTATITVTVVDDLHNHVIGNVDNLQDSLTKIGDSITELRNDMILRWEKEVTIDDENNWALPFDLKAKSTIFYNGTPLRPSQWSGIGSSTLTLGIFIRKYDHLVLIN